VIPIAGWVAPFGYPRIKACSRLPMAFRSVPRPSSPPGAKASTECPSYTRYARSSAEADEHTMHRNHPQTVQGYQPQGVSPLTLQQPLPSTIDRHIPIFAHNRILPDRSPSHRPRNTSLTPCITRTIAGQTVQHDRSHASEPSPPNHWGAYPEGPLSRSDMQLDDGTLANPYGSAAITRAQRRTRT
jgi:hypothetical protein